MIFLKKFLSLIRAFAYRLLRIQPLVQDMIQTESATLMSPHGPYVKLLDRILLLESQMQWRFLKQPQSTNSIQLEMASVLADKKQMIDLLAECYNKTARSVDIVTIVGAAKNVAVLGRSLVILSPSQVKHVTKSEGVTFLFPGNDLLAESVEEDLTLRQYITRCDPGSLLNALDDHSLDMIWISDYLYQCDPLRGLLFLITCLKKVRKGGRIEGVWFDQLPPDPRLIHTFDQRYFSMRDFRDSRVSINEGRLVIHC